MTTDSGAYRFADCPFCGSEIRHVESWARSFDPPQLWHEWHHVDDNDCWIRKRGNIVGFANDDPDTQERVIRRWNTRASVAATPVSVGEEELAQCLYEAEYDGEAYPWHRQRSDEQLTYREQAKKVLREYSVSRPNQRGDGS